MNNPRFRAGLILSLGLCLVASPLRAGTEETVTIPRSRYEELLRKEEELTRLRAKLEPSTPDTSSRAASPAPVLPSAAHAAAGAPAPSLPTAAASLPPLPDRGPVPAALLAGYLLRQPAFAAARLQNRNLQVHGRVVGFEKPLLTRNYHVWLETDEAAIRIRAVVVPPQQIRGAYVAQGGTTLMIADASGQRRPLLRLGDMVTLEGRVKGLQGNVVEMTGCRLLSPP